MPVEMFGWTVSKVRGEVVNVALPVVRFVVTRRPENRTGWLLLVTGLVEDRAAGTRRIYRLNEAGVAALRDQLDAFWRQTMSRYQRLMEEDE